MAGRKLINGKVDEGFEFVYYNLSYRRKMIRTLWLLPFNFLLLLPFFDEFVRRSFHLPGWILFAVCTLTTVAQYVYNRWKWIRTERGPSVVA